MLSEQGYKASPEQIIQTIKQYKEFQEGGQFSAKRYKKVLSLQGMNGEIFENNLSRDIASQQIRGAISASAFITAEENKTLAALEYQKRKIGYFDVSVNPYHKLIKINDADIKSYYEKNSQLYLTDEKVELEYIELNMNDVADRQEVTDEMVKQHYETSSVNYMANDDAAAKKKIEDLRKQVQQGADFAALAEKHSQDKGSAKQGGDLGYLTRGVEENFDKVVFALKKGEISQIIKSKSGFQIIKLNDIRAGDPEERKVSHILIKAERKLKPLADVKAAIIKELKYQQAGKVFYDDSDQLNNLSYETPDSLIPVADTLGLKLKSSPLITRRGGAGLFANPKILTAAFSNEVLRQGRNSELIELSDTHLIVLRVKQHQVAKVKPLDNLKSQIKSRLIQEQAVQKAQEVTADILSRLQNNEGVESVQRRYPEIKWMNTGWITRTVDKKSKSPALLSEQLRQYAFAMPKPTMEKTSWDKISLSAGDQAVVALFEVENATNTSADNSNIAQEMGNADYNSFVQYQKSQADISISPVAIDTESAAN